jgi:hypothetical protein
VADLCLPCLTACVLGPWPIVAQVQFPFLQVKRVAPLQPPSVCRQPLLLPPLLGRAGQRLSISPYGGRSLLRHVGFLCPHAFGYPLRARCVVSRFLAISGAASGWKALVSRSLAASMFSSSLTGSALAQLLSISPLLHVLINVHLHPGHMYSDLAARS